MMFTEKKSCMKNFCDFLREHAMEIIHFKKKKMKLLTIEHQEPYENSKVCYICNKKFKDKHAKDKKYRKLGIIFIVHVNIEVVRIAYVI